MPTKFDFFYPHLPDEETEALRSPVTRLGLLSQDTGHGDSNSRPGSGAHLPLCLLPLQGKAQVSEQALCLLGCRGLVYEVLGWDTSLGDREDAMNEAMPESRACLAHSSTGGASAISPGQILPLTCPSRPQPSSLSSPG